MFKIKSFLATVILSVSLLTPTVQRCDENASFALAAAAIIVVGCVTLVSRHVMFIEQVVQDKQEENQVLKEQITAMKEKMEERDNDGKKELAAEADVKRKLKEYYEQNAAEASKQVVKKEDKKEEAAPEKERTWHPKPRRSVF